MYNFGKTVNQVVIPDLSEQIILKTVAKAEQDYKEKEQAERMTALDFYYNVNMDKHIEQYFSSESLQQIPTYPSKVVPRFARARMMLYKTPPKRYFNGEENDDYKILSPYDESIGWINKKQVSFTFYQNPKTQKPCD